MSIFAQNDEIYTQMIAVAIYLPLIFAKKSDIMKIGVDLGGTNIRVGLIDGNAVIVKKTAQCPSDRAAEDVLDCLSGLISESLSPDVEGIGIGVPSVVDIEKGIVYDVVNIPSWKEVHLKEYMEKRFGKPTFINNDANCFALGETIFGSCRDCRNVVGITLGTGVGMGIIINGKLYNGVDASAGEMGAIPYLDSDYEHYCSSTFFTRCFGISGKDAAAGAAGGDIQSLDIWKEYGQHLGKFMTAVMLAYAPEAIVFGGSIASAFPFFEKSMRAELEHYPFQSTLRKLRIRTTAGGDTAILGASALVS